MEIADGIYTARAVSWGLGYTKGGKEQIAVQFELSDMGKTITWYGYFTDKTTDRTLDALRACGWTGSNFADMTGLDANEVQLTISNEEYEGKTTPRVKWVNRPGGLAIQKPMQADDIKKFAAKMKGLVIQFDKNVGAKPANGRKNDEPPF